MLRFRITNMTCGGCVKGVAATLREAAPDAEPHFDPDRREVALEAGDAARIERALADDGWESERLPG